MLANIRQSVKDDNEMTAKQYCEKTIKSTTPITWVDCTHREIREEETVPSSLLGRVQDAKVNGHELRDGREYIYLDIFF